MKIKRKAGLLLGWCGWLGIWALFAAPVGAADYITAPGETLAQVAQLTQCDPELLAAINGLTPEQELEPGSLLTLADEPQLALTVQAGDTLAALARDYGCAPAELARRNSLTQPYLLYPGQTLLLPLAEEQSCVVQREQTQLVEDEAWLLLAQTGEQGLSWPVNGVITSVFGPREGGWHYGLDIAADQGTPLLAAQAGTVLEADWKNDAYGYTVMLDHGNGLVTLYAHCSALLVKEGQELVRGQALALLGSTGRSTGPHVHFEVRLEGVCQDPQQWLPQSL